MRVRVARLGVGEWLLGVSSAVLLIDLFAADWFVTRPQHSATAGELSQASSATGWQAFDLVGPLALVVCLSGIAIMWFTAARRSPAVPAVTATLTLPFAILLGALITIRVLFDPPGLHPLGPGAIVDTRFGAYAGLVLSVGMMIGCFLALRRDGVAAEDSPSSIQTLSVEATRIEGPA